MRIVDKILLEKYRDKACEICGLCQGTHAHHIKTKGSGGDDVPNNLICLCQGHHVEIHAIGTTTFAEKYPEFKQYLLDKGWKLDEFSNKWMRLRQEGWEHE